MTTWHGPVQHSPTSAPLVTLAMVLGGAFAALWTLFLVGEFVSDPGGWLGVALAAALVVPILLLGALAWWRPSWGAPLLTALVGLWVVAAAVSVVYADEWQAYEDAHGPVSLILMLGLCSPLVALGRSRTTLAGVLLLVTLVVPLVAGLLWLAVGAGFGGVPALFTVGLPFAAVGVLYVAAAVIDRRGERAHPSG